LTAFAGVPYVFLDGLLLSIRIFEGAAIAGGMCQQKYTYTVNAAREQQLHNPMSDVPRKAT